jgi:hypothetical protein
VPAQIDTANIVSYDPNGEAGENDETIKNLVDNSTGTSWTTQCYLDQYLTVKGGLGVVIPLTTPDTGQLTVTFGLAPWEAEVYVADGIPATLDAGWIQVDASRSSAELTHTFNLGGAPHSHVLLWLTKQLPKDPACSKNPYRGSVAEVSFQSVRG